MNRHLAGVPLRRVAILIWTTLVAVMAPAAVAAAAHVRTHRPGVGARPAARRAPVRPTTIQPGPVRRHPARRRAFARALAARQAAARSRLTTHGQLHRAAAHAHMAGDPAVSIVDFSFSPGTTTVHVGDTITWTNAGKQPHSATANDHSFDTGLLRTGQSGSHTFTTSGTFTYYCIVHPYMHGTVIVLAATTTTTTTPTTTGSTTPTTPTSTTSPTTTAQTTGQTLPLTGFDDLGAFALGLSLVAAGFVVRIRMRPRSDS